MNTSQILSILSLSPYFIVLFLGILLCFILFRRWKKREAIDIDMRDNGLRANGRIVRCHRGVLTFDLVYLYEIEEITYSQVQHVDATICSNVQPGDEVIVCYKAENPGNSVLLDVGIAYVEFQLTFALTVIVVIYGTMYIVIGIIALITTFI